MHPLTPATPPRHIWPSLLAMLISAGVLSCGGEEKLQPLRIDFAARVGSLPFVCGQASPAVGTTSAKIEVQDFRMFVSNIRTVDKAGKEHPVTLVPDGKWQSSTVVLLDFENASGPCGELGTADVNAAIVANGDGSDIAALRFSLGVPAAEAHQNVGLAPAPLSLAAMFWGWQAGYKFMRVDFKATSGDVEAPGQQWLIHVGSTGCQSAASTTPPVTACARSNRAEITLPGWNASKKIAVDLASVLDTVDVLTNTPATAPGCMSDADDPECKALLPNLGLDAATGQCAAGCIGQKLFRLE